MTEIARTSLAVRTARPADLDRLAWLESVSFHDAWARELLAYELTFPNSLLLAAGEAPGENGAERLPLGYAAFRHGGGEAELLRLAVAPEARRRGLARALVEEGLERLRRQGIAHCFLEVRIDNLGAIRLYETLGWTRTGVRRRYYRDDSDALVYARRV
jgi:[ribosomal protein S18]-alanine N-acetyltransferase